MSAKRTESEMLSLLRQRYTEKAGNGDAWAFVTGVRDAAGFDAKRTLDAMAMSLWPSRGLLVHGFEVKCSRSDWLREMKEPAKAEGFCQKVDHFWIVAATDDVVADGELPPTWGLLVARGSRLVAKVEAPLLRSLAREDPHAPAPLPPNIDRTFLAALMRSACRVGSATPAEIAEAREEAHTAAERHLNAATEGWRERCDQAEGTIREFERAAGVSLTFGYPGQGGPAAVGGAVKTVLNGEFQVDNVRKRLARLRTEARAIEEFVGRQLAEFGEGTGE